MQQRSSKRVEFLGCRCVCVLRGGSVESSQRLSLQPARVRTMVCSGCRVLPQQPGLPLQPSWSAAAPSAALVRPRVFHRLRVGSFHSRPVHRPLLALAGRASPQDWPQQAVPTAGQCRIQEAVHQAHVLQIQTISCTELGLGAASGVTPPAGGFEHSRPVHRPTARAGWAAQPTGRAAAGPSAAGHRQIQEAVHQGVRSRLCCGGGKVPVS